MRVRRVLVAGSSLATVAGSFVGALAAGPAAAAPYGLTDLGAVTPAAVVGAAVADSSATGVIVDDEPTPG